MHCFTNKWSNLPRVILHRVWFSESRKTNDSYNWLNSYLSSTFTKIEYDDNCWQPNSTVKRINIASAHVSLIFALFHIWVFTSVELDWNEGQYCQRFDAFLPGRLLLFCSYLLLADNQQKKRHKRLTDHLRREIFFQESKKKSVVKPEITALKKSMLTLCTHFFRYF